MPLVVRTVDEAPTDPRPVPPFAIFNVPPRVREPEEVIGPPVKERPVVPPEASTDVTVPEVIVERHFVVPEIQILAASMPPAKVEVAVEVAMKRSAARELVPVAVRRDPFQVKTVPLAEMPVRSRPIVPELVMVPPVRPFPVATEVTVPFVIVVKHWEEPERQTLAASIPPANVVEAAEVKLFVPEKVLLLVRVEVDVRYPTPATAARVV